MVIFSMLQYTLYTLLVVGVLSSTQITIEPCTVDPTQEFVVNSDGTIHNGGGCVDNDGTYIFVNSCSGSLSQQWIWRNDSTVQNVQSTNLCFNVLYGDTAPGSVVGVYTCDDIESGLGIVGNDLFTQIDNNRIYANESGLCLYSAPQPPCDNRCCSLNGQFDQVKQQCACFAPWTGPNCTTLDIVPQTTLQGYGLFPNLTSWGGNFIQTDDGMYHIFVAQMANGCPLSDWQSNSMCVHAISNSGPTGPFIFNDIAIPVWCHNPQVFTIQNGTQTLYAIIHIGDGVGGKPNVCESQTEMSYFQPEKLNLRKKVGTNGGSLHISSSVYGPWTAVSSLPNCNNPSPWQHPNSTWYLACYNDDFVIFSSNDILNGPWTPVPIQLNTAGQVSGTYEDCFLWIDPRGYWHSLFHVYVTQTFGTCVNSTVSGHYFSVDGINWEASLVAPYGNEVIFSDGTSMTLPTRERPKLYFDEDGDPIYLINGVTGGTSVCDPTPCVNCKYNYWDFTLVSVLNA